MAHPSNLKFNLRQGIQAFQAATPGLLMCARAIPALDPFLKATQAITQGTDGDFSAPRLQAIESLPGILEHYRQQGDFTLLSPGDVTDLAQAFTQHIEAPLRQLIDEELPRRTAAALIDFVVEHRMEFSAMIDPLGSIRSEPVVDLYNGLHSAWNTLGEISREMDRTPHAIARAFTPKRMTSLLSLQEKLAQAHSWLELFSEIHDPAPLPEFTEQAVASAKTLMEDFAPCHTALQELQTVLAQRGAGVGGKP